MRDRLEKDAFDEDLPTEETLLKSQIISIN